MPYKEIKMSSIQKITLWLITASFFSLSTYCEVSLFVSFTEGLGNQVMASIFGFALVLSQLVFAGLIPGLINKKLWVLLSMLALSLGALLFISISGTAYYFERNFSEANISDIKSTSIYQYQLELIDEKKNSIKGLKDLAKKEEDKGNGWIAGQYREKSLKAEMDIQVMISKLSSMENGSAKGTSIINNSLGELRWLVWFLFAIVADLIPVLSIVLLNTRENKHKTTSKHQNEPTDDHRTSIRDIVNTEKRVPSVREAYSMGIKYKEFKHEIDILIKEGLIESKDTGKGWIAI